MHRTYADWFSFQPNVWAPTLFVRPLDRACDGIEVYKECHITGEEYSVEMMTNDFLLWRDKGVLVQDALPYLSAEEREFLVSGINPTEWSELYEDDEVRWTKGGE